MPILRRAGRLVRRASVSWNEPTKGPVAMPPKVNAHPFTPRFASWKGYSSMSALSVARLPRTTTTQKKSPQPAAAPKNIFSFVLFSAAAPPAKSPTPNSSSSPSRRATTTTFSALSIISAPPVCMPIRRPTLASPKPSISLRASASPTAAGSSTIPTPNPSHYLSRNPSDSQAAGIRSAPSESSAGSIQKP